MGGMTTKPIARNDMRTLARTVVLSWMQPSTSQCSYPHVGLDGGLGAGEGTEKGGGGSIATHEDLPKPLCWRTVSGPLFLFLHRVSVVWTTALSVWP